MTLSRRHLAPRLVLALVLLAGSQIAPPFQEARAVAPPSVPVAAMTWNVAGNSAGFSNGYSDSTASSMPGRAVTWLENNFSKSSAGIQFAGFTEICYSQYREIVGQLTAANWPFNTSDFSHFWTHSPPAGDNPTLCNGDASVGVSQSQDVFGNALISIDELGPVQGTVLSYEHHTSDNTYETRTLVCAIDQDHTNVKLCVTHPTTVDPDKDSQTQTIFQTLDGDAANHITDVLVGDFNNEPGSSDFATPYSGSETVQNTWTELGSTNASCTGYGVWSVLQQATTAPSNCGPSQNPCVSSINPCKKIDQMFIQTARRASGTSISEAGTAWEPNSPSITCTADGSITGGKSVGTGYPVAINRGSCSDHRMLTGAATVLTYPAS